MVLEHSVHIDSQYDTHNIIVITIKETWSKRKVARESFPMFVSANQRIAPIFFSR